MHLPVYSTRPQEVARLIDFQPDRPKDLYACACGYSMQLLLERGQPLQLHEADPLPVKTIEDADTGK